MPRSPKKSPMKKRTTSKKKNTHPTYKDMITEAIMEDKKWTKGSSRQSITKYIVTNYGIDENTVRQKLRPALRRLTEEEEGPVLVQPTVGCFKLNPDWREEWKKKQERKTTIKPKKKSSTTPRKKRKMGGKRKKSSGRRKKDKDAPRKNYSAYIIFSNSIRKSVRDKNPDFDFGDISRKISEKWNKLPDSKREKFNILAAEDKKRYEREMKAYKKKKKKESSTSSSSTPSSSSSSSSTSSSEDESKSSSSSSEKKKKEKEKSEKEKEKEKSEKSEKEKSEKEKSEKEKEKDEKGREKSKTDLKKIETKEKKSSSSSE